MVECFDALARGSRYTKVEFQTVESEGKKKKRVYQL